MKVIPQTYLMKVIPQTYRTHEEEFDDTKIGITIRQSNDRQHNGQENRK